VFIIRGGARPRHRLEQYLAAVCKTNRNHGGGFRGERGEASREKVAKLKGVFCGEGGKDE
jgi:hypothetical protein